MEGSTLSKFFTTATIRSETSPASMNVAKLRTNAGWTWADTQAAKLKLAKRRQAEAARAEVQRLQELLSGYHSRLEESGKRVEEEEVRLREEKRQAVARGKARTQEMQRRRATQFEQAAEQRAANAAANAELFSEQRAATVAAREEMIQARSAAHARKVEASKERRRLVAEKERQEAEQAQEMEEEAHRRSNLTFWQKFDEDFPELYVLFWVLVLVGVPSGLLMLWLFLRS